ncbi:hypothetical protein SCUP515_13165 [Seiridium cupressi]
MTTIAPPNLAEFSRVCYIETFVENTVFTLTVPCFNVMSKSFVGGVETATVAPSATAAATGSSSTPNSQYSSSSPSSTGDGLYTGAKAGIAVGVVVASLAIVGAIAFTSLRKRNSSAATEDLPGPAMKARQDAPSIASGTRK